MEDVSRLAFFAQQNWNISHSQCMEPGDNHSVEEAWFLVKPSSLWCCQIWSRLGCLEFRRFSQCLLIGFFMWFRNLCLGRSRTCHKRHNGVTWRLNFLRFKVLQSLFPIWQTARYDFQVMFQFLFENMAPKKHDSNSKDVYWTCCQVCVAANFELGHSSLSLDLERVGMLWGVSCLIISNGSHPDNILLLWACLPKTWRTLASWRKATNAIKTYWAMAANLIIFFSICAHRLFFDGPRFEVMGALSQKLRDCLGFCLVTPQIADLE